MGVREWSDFIILVGIMYIFSALLMMPVWGLMFAVWASLRQRRAGRWECWAVVMVLVLVPAPLTVWALNRLVEQA
jgi:hypothetical protein